MKGNKTGTNITHRMCQITMYDKMYLFNLLLQLQFLQQSDYK